MADARLLLVVELPVKPDYRQFRVTNSSED
jgi:hypothetical protein